LPRTGSPEDLRRENKRGEEKRREEKRGEERRREERRREEISTHTLRSVAAADGFDYLLRGQDRPILCNYGRL
jgi:hypothetical protein